MQIPMGDASAIKDMWIRPIHANKINIGEGSII